MSVFVLRAFPTASVLLNTPLRSAPESVPLEAAYLFARDLPTFMTATFTVPAPKPAVVFPRCCVSVRVSSADTLTSPVLYSLAVFKFVLTVLSIDNTLTPTATAPPPIARASSACVTLAAFVAPISIEAALLPIVILLSLLVSAVPMAALLTSVVTFAFMLPELILPLTLQINPPRKLYNRYVSSVVLVA